MEISYFISSLLLQPAYFFPSPAKQISLCFLFTFDLLCSTKHTCTRSAHKQAPFDIRLGNLWLIWCLTRLWSIAHLGSTQCHSHSTLKGGRVEWLLLGSVELDHLTRRAFGQPRETHTSYHLILAVAWQENTFPRGTNVKSSSFFNIYKRSISLWLLFHTCQANNWTQHSCLLCSKSSGMPTWKWTDNFLLIVYS